MIDFYKKANFYFIAIPLTAAVWALLTSTLFLNAANDEWKDTKAESDKSENFIAQILVLDPERLKLHNEKKKIGKFDYNTVIGKFAIRHKIAESGYGLKVTGEKKKKSMIVQTARMTINDINVEKFTRFLSEMLHVWPDLQCDNLTMTNTGPDTWKAVLQFKYTFKKGK
jgi:hypothetical protein